MTINIQTPFSNKTDDDLETELDYLLREIAALKEANKPIFDEHAKLWASFNAIEKELDLRHSELE